MSRREAERFENAWEQVAQGGKTEGSLAPLVETAQRATVLAGPPPPPPHQLAPGRQRFLAQAAHLRTEKTEPRKERVQTMVVIKLVTTLTTAVLLIGMLFGVGPAAAESLPGEALYNMKLFAEEARLALTSDPVTMAELNAERAEERLDEVAALMEQGQAIGQATQVRAEQQMRLALGAALQAGDPARTRLLQRLQMMLQERQQKMAALAGAAAEPTQLRVRLLLREMERVREEAHAGQGEPDGEQHRQRLGTPQATPPGEQQGPKPTEPPGAGPGPQPTDKPAGLKPTDRPGPGPRPTDKPGGPKPTDPPGPGPQPTDKPGGPKPTEEPGPGPGPQPTDKPAGPQPTEDPGQGPGPQPTDKPSGPQPTEDPGQGTGPQPTDDPGGGSGPGPAPTQAPGGGSGRP